MCTSQRSAVVVLGRGCTKTAIGSRFHPMVQVQSSFHPKRCALATGYRHMGAGVIFQAESRLSHKYPCSPAPSGSRCFPYAWLTDTMMSKEDLVETTDSAPVQETKGSAPPKRYTPSVLWWTKNRCVCCCCWWFFFVEKPVPRIVFCSLTSSVPCIVFYDGTVRHRCQFALARRKDWRASNGASSPILSSTTNKKQSFCCCFSRVNPIYHLYKLKCTCVSAADLTDAAPAPPIQQGRF